MPLLPRLQLAELEDQDWLPVLFRDFATDYLHALESALGVGSIVAPEVSKLLDGSSEHRIVDLCSGASGPIVDLEQALRDAGYRVAIHLTDRYPNLPALSRLESLRPSFVGERESVDARQVPRRLEGVRTLFNAFHHFEPLEAEGILRDAVRCRHPIAIFELVERRFVALSSMVWVPLFVLVVTPFLRPRRWSRWLFTYLLPVVPLLCLWDGVVSHLRAYSLSELRALAEKVAEPDYDFEVGILKRRLVRVTYLVGRPSSQQAEATGAVPLGEPRERVESSETV